jgi:hypothetical protein
MVVMTLGYSAGQRSRVNFAEAGKWLFPDIRRTPHGRVLTAFPLATLAA